jgi:hypothetical protein
MPQIALKLPALVPRLADPDLLHRALATGVMAAPGGRRTSLADREAQIISERPLSE